MIDSGLQYQNKLFLKRGVVLVIGYFPDKIDEKTLSRKYRTNVGKLIRAWKHGLSDQEVAAKTGVGLSTIHSIKQDLELAHRYIRLSRKKQQFNAHALGSDQIFFSPDI